MHLPLKKTHFTEKEFYKALDQGQKLYDQAEPRGRFYKNKAGEYCYETAYSACVIDLHSFEFPFELYALPSLFYIEGEEYSWDSISECFDNWSDSEEPLIDGELTICESVTEDFQLSRIFNFNHIYEDIDNRLIEEVSHHLLTNKMKWPKDLSPDQELNKVLADAAQAWLSRHKVFPEMWHAEDIRKIRIKYWLNADNDIQWDYLDKGDA